MDNRYEHGHSQHHELMLPCYPACQLYPVGTQLQHRDGFRLMVSQRYDNQVVLQRGGMDYCRATVEEVQRYTRILAPLACGHVEPSEHPDRYEVDGAFICSKCFDAEVVRAVLAECACGGCHVVAR